MIDTDQHEQGTSLGQWLIDTYRRRDSLPTHPRVVHEQTIAAVRTSAFYGVLNCQTDFRRALQTLFENWTSASAQDFMTAWNLPQAALNDLDWSRNLWLLRGKRAPGLEVGYRRHSRPDRPSSYVKWPPRLRNARMLQVGAQRLYARAVEGKSPREIAAAEKGIIRQRAADTKSVRKSTRAWSRAVGVRLPKRPSGRPRTRRRP